MFEYESFRFSPFGTIREVRRLNEFQRFLDYFSVKFLFPKISLDLIVCSSFFIIMG